MKKKYESTKICRDRYNKNNSTVQISRNLVDSIKNFIDKSTTLKEFIELSIIEKIEKDKK